MVASRSIIKDPERRRVVLSRLILIRPLRSEKTMAFRAPCAQSMCKQKEREKREKEQDTTATNSLFKGLLRMKRKREKREKKNKN